ncbi:hypothetical protein [Marinobacter alexandrii]|jgi:hypothetical protein|uniref:hypothetical protein n=1 Tax=Marinobacter alexandrii TaxID=2570351 RepID=UPI002ABD2E4B|nr:hypothetical protein [Marinobacter alexandrii]
MGCKNLLIRFMADILKGLESLSDSDLKKLESGSFYIEFRIVRKKEYAQDTVSLSKEDADDLLEKLRECHDRDSGYELLKASLKTKKDLERFAKLIDIYVMKQDRVEKIRDKIVEGVIGASIRSTVIQGKNT